MIPFFYLIECNNNYLLFINQHLLSKKILNLKMKKILNLKMTILTLRMIIPKKKILNLKMKIPKVAFHQYKPQTLKRMITKVHQKTNLNSEMKNSRKKVLLILFN